MHIKTGKLVTFCALLIYGTFVHGQTQLYGIYSNLNAEQGEPSGMEMFFLHNGRPGLCSTSVLFQIAEGWPQHPELIDCCQCTDNQVQFTTTLLGDFIGKVENGVMVGEFPKGRHAVALPKGKSYWQK